MCYFYSGFIKSPRLQLENEGKIRASNNCDFKKNKELQSFFDCTQKMACFTAGILMHSVELNFLLKARLMKVDVVSLQAGLLCCCLKSHSRKFWEGEQGPVKCFTWWIKEQSYCKNTKELPNRQPEETFWLSAFNLPFVYHRHS